MEEKKGMSLSTGILIGIGIGAIIAYLIYLSRKNSSQSTTLNLTNSELKTLQQRIDSMENKLDRLQQSSQSFPYLPPQSQSSPEVMTYKNKMHIIRDENGDIVNIERDAKIIGNNKKQ